LGSLSRILESDKHRTNSLLGLTRTWAEDIEFRSSLKGESKGTPIEEADRIAEEVRMRVHKSIKGAYCVIHMDAAGIP